MGKSQFEKNVEIRLPSHTRYLHGMYQLTRTLAQSAGLDPRESDQAALAVEEALTNVIEHAYHGEQNRKMRPFPIVWVNVCERALSRIRDGVSAADRAPRCPHGRPDGLRTKISIRKKNFRPERSGKEG